MGVFELFFISFSFRAKLPLLFRVAFSWAFVLRLFCLCYVAYESFENIFQIR